jgi:brefeldin A-inhibited guanine nucleotide-exchange protein
MPAVRKLIKQKYTDPQACQRALEHLENLESGRGDIERSFYVLKLACQSRSSRIVVIALDCIQKLVAYGYLKGTRMDPHEQTKGLLIDTIVESVCNCFHGPATDDGVQLQIIKALLTLVTSPNCQVHESSLLLAIQTCFDIYLSSRNVTNQNTAKATLTQMYNSSFQKMESYSGDELDDYIIAQCLAQVVSQVDQELPTYTKTQDFEPSNILHYDAYIIFHALCKLSLRQVSDEHPLKLKLLSLQLILAILQNAGSVLRSSEIFLAAIKQCLCVALSKNGLSNNNEVLSLSLSIFMCLLKDFKVHLKMQIEVFFKEILIHIIESPSSSFDQKWMVLDALISMCSDPQCIVDIFVNYDCDLQSTNIFERIVTLLSKIAQTKGQANSNDVAAKIRERNLRLRGFECLVVILKCMVDWSKDLYINPFLTTFKNRPPAQENKLTALTVDQTSISSNDSNKIASTTTIAKPCCNGFSSTTNATSTSNTNTQTNINNNNINDSMISSHNATNGSAANGSTNNQSNSDGSSFSSDIQNLPSARDDPEQIEVTKMHKGIIEQGYDLFNRKPKRGLEFLQKHGYLGYTDLDIAKFLFANSDKLDKTTLGEYIGDLNNKEIMYMFVDQMNFAGKDIVAALRHFLDHFRLPGEAQKIDRLMEKFAARYCETNPHNKLFHSADVAYILSYSIIILTTDLHSPSIKQKMTKEQYIRMNQPTDNRDKGLPEDFLSSIYDEIASSEIKIKGTTKISAQVPPPHTTKWTDKLASSSSKQRRILYDKEMESMAETARILMESVSHVEAQFTLASHVEYVKPMFKIAWTPFLVAFSVGLQEIDDDNITYLCLLGFRYALRVAGTFRMDSERDAFIQALSRFTLLTTSLKNQSKNAETRHAKNVNTIKTLIMVAHSEGNYLGNSWLEVLRCVSQLEYAQLLGANNQVTDMPDKNSLNNLSTLQEKFESLTISITEGGNRRNIKLLSDNLNNIASQSIFLAVDRIFTGSVLLDGDAIVDFVRALCQISNEELANPTQPRMFSLQKLVEISYYNMDRIRLQWSRIWSILGEHFNRVGCNPNEEVSIFAIDSLRQLAMKFIEKGEFSNFRFQKDFLRPFECIMQNNSSVSIRDMVVRCICQMVSSQSNNIKSGWKNIFHIIRMAVWDSEQTIVILAYKTAADIIQLYPTLSNLNQVIEEKEYRLFIGSIYHSLSNLIQYDLKPESRSVVKHILLRIGDIYSITNTNNIT